MARRSRTRRVLKWAGLTLAVFFVLASVASAWYTVIWCDPVRPFVVIEAGYISCDFTRGHPRLQAPVGLTVDRREPYVDLWAFAFDVGKLERNGYERCFIACPFWVLAVLAMTPPVLFWLLPNRHPSGCCRHCGCNLTGNVTGRCPECGEKT